MSTSVILILAILGVFVIYAIAAPFVLNLGRFLGRSWLYCPQRKEHALISLHSLRAAMTAGYGGPALAVRTCTLRNPGELCDERCLLGSHF